MVDLSPRQQFQSLRKEDADKLAAIMNEPAMRTALTYAFAHLGHTGVTPDELNGAKKFIVILASLHEPEIKRRLPQKSLSH